MKRLAAPVLVLLLSGCVSPSFHDRDYELKAGNTAKAVASSVATALLGAEAARRHQATGPYLSVLLGSAEKDALSVQSTFDGVQPPDAAADTLRGTVDDLLSSATTGLTEMRIVCRRGQLDKLPAFADRLRATLVELRSLADRYQ
ncbi:MAG: hypothetical protein JWL79_1037 [Frankiales bacterium]|nr:hypothetical protein [Frankiales bacterium]